MLKYKIIIFLFAMSCMSGDVLAKTNKKVPLTRGDDFSNSDDSFDDLDKAPDDSGSASKDTSEASKKDAKIPVAEPSSVIEDAEDMFLQPVSMDFKGASLREVIATLASETHINFIVPDKVGDQKVNISLKNVPWKQALQGILETNGLGLVKMEGNVVRLDSISTLQKEKQDANNIKQQAAVATPTKVLVVRLSYAKATDMVKIITDMLPSAAYDKRVKVEADDRTNSLVVEAIPQELSKIRSLIERVDLQTPQVRISSRVIEVLASNDNYLGINWGGPVNYDQGRGLGFGNLVFPNNIISAFSVDQGAATSARQDGKFDIHVGSLNNMMALDLRLRMGELTSQTKSLQNNNVLVLDGQKAKISAGSEDYFTVPLGQGQTSMSSVSYLLSLEVTPHITADGAVQMVIDIENSAPTKPSATVVGASTSKSLRSLTTSMLRKSGETAVIGGLYTTSYADTKQGVPILKDIPIVGMFFQSSAKSETKHELIILVTPTIINASDRMAVIDTNNNQDSAQDFTTKDLDDDVVVKSTEKIDVDAGSNTDSAGSTEKSSTNQGTSK